MKAEYLTCAQTAKLIRTALKKAFPGVKFSVRTSKSGGAVNVKWTDGPTDADVSAIAKQYQGGRFDSMIDMAISAYHWLRPDGSAVVASCDGTTGNAGTIEAIRQWMPEPGCKLVHFGAKYVFCNRSFSVAFLTRRAERVAERYGVELPPGHVAEAGFGAFIKNDHFLPMIGDRPFSEVVWKAASRCRAA